MSASQGDSLPFVWHEKLRAAFELVKANASNVDLNAERLATQFGRDQAQFKKSFYQNQDRLDRFREKAESAYPLLLGRLGSAGLKDRRRALHTFAAAASLRVIQLLQRFEGELYSESGQLVVRLFPDLPGLQKQSGPLVGLPYRHAVNELAYGEVWGRAFVSCRISRGRESDYKYVHLPVFEAESFQGTRPGPDHLYDGWVLPQWLLLVDGEPPDKDKWWITVLIDELGVERWSALRPSPWSTPDATRAELPREYDWPKDVYEPAEIAPELSCWVMRVKRKRKS